VWPRNEILTLKIAIWNNAVCNKCNKNERYWDSNSWTNKELNSLLRWQDSTEDLTAITTLYAIWIQNTVNTETSVACVWNVPTYVGRCFSWNDLLYPVPSAHAGNKRWVVRVVCTFIKLCVFPENVLLHYNAVRSEFRRGINIHTQTGKMWNGERGSCITLANLCDLRNSPLFLWMCCNRTANWFVVCKYSPLTVMLRIHKLIDSNVSWRLSVKSIFGAEITM
jgi:hypothetical protein